MVMMQENKNGLVLVSSMDCAAKIFTSAFCIVFRWQIINVPSPPQFKALQVPAPVDTQTATINTQEADSVSDYYTNQCKSQQRFGVPV